MGQKIEADEREGREAVESARLAIYRRVIELVKDNPDKFLVQYNDIASSSFTLGTMLIDKEGERRYLSVELDFKRHRVYKIGLRLGSIEASYPRFRYLPSETYLLTGSVGGDALSDDFEKAQLPVTRALDFVSNSDIRLPERGDYHNLSSMTDADFEYFFTKHCRFDQSKARLKAIYGNFEASS